MQTERFGSPALDARIVVIACAAVVAVAIWPIIVTEFLPLFDYPNHLARMHILLAYDRAPTLHEFYEVVWAPLSNLAMELVVLPLAAVLPLAVAGKAFVALSLALQMAGVVAVHRAMHGRWSPWPLGAAVLLYNDTFGFVNYLFGFGLALLFFAAWIALAARPIGLRLAVGTVAATILFFCHIAALGVYAVLVCGYAAGRLLDRGEAGPAAAWRNAALTLGQFALPAAIMLGFSPTGEGAANDWSWLTDKWHYFQKLGLVDDMFNSYDLMLDRIAAASVGLLIVGGLAARRLAFARYGFMTTLAVAVSFALAPKRFLTGDFLDDRLVLAVAFTLFAAIDWRGVGRRWQYAVAAAMAALFVARTVAIEAVWRTWDPEFAAIVRSFDAVPEGARLMAAIGYCCDAWARRRPPFMHLPSYVVTRRNGFFPLVFAIAGQQPIARRPSYEALAKPVLFNITVRTGGARGANPLAANPYLPERLAGFDYMLVVNGDQFGTPPPRNLVPVVTGDRFGLYRIEPAG